MIRFNLLVLIITLLINLLNAANKADPVFDDSEVAIINVTIDPDDLAWIYEWDNRESDSLHVCQVQFTNAQLSETIDSVGFRLRGNTSRDSNKKSFKLSFNTFISGREFYGLDKLNLNGEHNDPSICRSKICWDFFQKTGMKASRAAHAAVYINGDYYGLYIMIEHIDDEFLSMNYPDDSGNLWKCLWPADLTYRGTSGSDYFPYSGDTRPYELKTNDELYDYSKLAKLITILNKTDAADLEDSLETILLVPEVLKYFAINILSGSWDDYWATMNNYYLYHEPSIDKYHFIPYDYDNTLGISWSETDWSQVDPYIFGRVSDGDRPLAENLMANARYRDLYTHFLSFYSDNIIELTNWEARIDSIKEMIRPYVIDDPYYPQDYGFSINDFDDSFSAESYNKLHVKRGIKEFINRRTSSISSQLSWQYGGPIVYQIEMQKLSEVQNDSIEVFAAAFSPLGIKNLTLNYYLDQLDTPIQYEMTYNPVLNSIRVEDSDRFSTVIPNATAGQSNYFTITIEDVNGNQQTYPRTESIKIIGAGISSSKLVINEFMAKNSTTITDDHNDYEDWIEIYNPSDESILLSGLYLSDDPDNLTRWQFPGSDIEIAAGAYLLIWCDDETDEGNFHTNFKLDKDGEYIALTENDGVTIIDSYTFSTQQEDVSFARNPNGTGDFEAMDPTPGYSNSTNSIEKDKFPEIFDLVAYPNPFNGIVTFKYHLETPQLVQLQIYNSLGKCVWQQPKVFRSAGAHKVQWQAKDNQGNAISSGVYFYRINTQRNSASGKIVYIK